MGVPLHGQVTLSGSPAQLDPTSQAGSCQAFTIKAPRSNTAAAFIGGSAVTTSNGFQLDPGDELTYERIGQVGQPSYQLRPSDFYAVGTGGVVTWLASP